VSTPRSGLGTGLPKQNSARLLDGVVPVFHIFRYPSKMDNATGKETLAHHYIRKAEEEEEGKTEELVVSNNLLS
jgi:hypothetical protein